MEDEIGFFNDLFFSIFIMSMIGILFFTIYHYNLYDYEINLNYDNFEGNCEKITHIENVVINGNLESRVITEKFNCSDLNEWRTIKNDYS